MPKKLKINGNSWHYNIYSHMTNGEMPKDLCSYMKLVMSGLTLITFGIAITATMLVVGGIALWKGFSECPLSMIMTLSGAVVLIAIPFGLSKLIELSYSKLFSENSLIGAWLKAKKEKYCPMIEVVDDEKSKQA